jgi:lysozyme family protein
MSDLVDRAISEVIERESGFIDHPADRGGPTKYGITLSTLRQWRGTPVTVEDIAALTIAEAKEIYTAHYAKPLMRLEFVPEVFRLLLDIAVLSGPGTAVRTLQTVLNENAGANYLVVDGVLGEKTVMAVARKSPPLVVQALAKARCRALVQIVERDASQLAFLEGWIMRTLSFLPEPA